VAPTRGRTRKAAGTRSPTVRPPTSDPPAELRGRLAARLRERVGLLERSLEGLLAAGPPTPERIHRSHGEIRRTRAELRIWRRIVSPARAERMRALDRRLAELARRVGEVRDIDVRIALLEGVGAAEAQETPGQRRLRNAVLVQLRDEGAIGRELLRAYARAEREAGLFLQLREALGAAAPGRARVAGGPVRAERARLEARLRRSWRRARRRLSVKRAHRLRILLRRARTTHAFLRALPAAVMPPYPGRLVRLQRALGRVHDLDLISDWLEELAPELGASAWAERLREERRTERRALERALRERGNGRAIRLLRG
jgi:CHAD domain-containing protein